MNGSRVVGDAVALGIERGRLDINPIWASKGKDREFRNGEGSHVI